eukprot:78453-Amorphochlora_amoeboformis.AAC.1
MERTRQSHCPCKAATRELEVPIMSRENIVFTRNPPELDGVPVSDRGLANFGGQDLAAIGRFD